MVVNRCHKAISWVEKRTTLALAESQTELIHITLAPRRGDCGLPIEDLVPSAEKLLEVLAARLAGSIRVVAPLPQHEQKNFVRYRNRASLPYLSAGTST